MSVLIREHDFVNAILSSNKIQQIDQRIDQYFGDSHVLKVVNCTVADLQHELENFVCHCDPTKIPDT